MKNMSFRSYILPLIKTIDLYNNILKSHHKRVAIISHNIGIKMNLEMTKQCNLITAASIHDIGALSISDRDNLFSEDVVNPSPHCIMGYKMLEPYPSFIGIAEIIRHHHIQYDELSKYKTEIPIECHILHLADRVEVLVNNRKMNKNNVLEIVNKILEKTGSVFHPLVSRAFTEIAKDDDFWLNIDEKQLEDLFSNLDFPLDEELTKEEVLQFSQVISRIVDFRSEFTVVHSYCVGHIAYNIGKWLSLKDDDCDKLLVAGYFHDIGSIALEPNIFENQGLLSNDDFQSYKSHAQYTEKILNGLKLHEWFDDVIKWASGHHEKNDGTGYPKGLTESSIDIGVRIIAYADIICALLEDRPYRKKFHIDYVIDLIEKEYSSRISYEIFQVISNKKREISELYSDYKNEIINQYYDELK